MMISWLLLAVSALKFLKVQKSVFKFKFLITLEQFMERERFMLIGNQFFLILYLAPTKEELI